MINAVGFCILRFFYRTLSLDLLHSVTELLTNLLSFPLAIGVE